jgi:hypothetical protein
MNADKRRLTVLYQRSSAVLFLVAASPRWDTHVDSLENRPFLPPVTQNGLILNHAIF